jgi:hypothetical protein
VFTFFGTQTYAKPKTLGCEFVALKIKLRYDAQ